MGGVDDTHKYMLPRGLGLPLRKEIECFDGNTSPTPRENFSSTMFLHPRELHLVRTKGWLLFMWPFFLLNALLIPAHSTSKPPEHGKSVPHTALFERSLTLSEYVRIKGCYLRLLQEGVEHPTSPCLHPFVLVLFLGSFQSALQEDTVLVS